MWSGIGIPKAETDDRSHRSSYATPHEVITSYRLPDKGYFAFIYHCFINDCKVSTFSHFVNVWNDPIPAPTFYQWVMWLLWHHISPLQHNCCNAPAKMNSGRVDIKWWDSWKRALIKLIINTILHSLGYWPTIGLYFIRYKKKTTFIWCAVCGEIGPHTGDPQ